MSATGDVMRSQDEALPRQHHQLSFAWREFLRVPVAVMASCLAAAGVTVSIDAAAFDWAGPARGAIAVVVPPAASATLLQTVTPGLITAVSIIFFVMLMGLNKISADLSPVVLDQFLRRRANQFAFGLYVGVLLYCVLALAFVPPGQALLSVAVIVPLVAVALGLLPFLLYLTVTQMRPSQVVWFVKQAALYARDGQEPLLARTHLRSQLPDAATTPVVAGDDGYIVHINGHRLARATQQADSPMEIVFHLGMGAQAITGVHLAEIRGGSTSERDQLAHTVLESITLAQTPDLGRDPGYAVESLGSMAWSAASQDPQTCIAPVSALHALLTRWGQQRTHPPDPDRYGGTLPISYYDDSLEKVADALTNVVIVAVPAHQHQASSRVLQAFADALPRISQSDQHLILDRLQRVLPLTAEHIRTPDLAHAIENLRATLHHTGYPEQAESLCHIEQRMTPQPTPDGDRPIRVREPPRG